MARSLGSRLVPLVTVSLAAALCVAPSAAAPPPDPVAARAAALPDVAPTPQHVARVGDDIPVAGRVLVVVGPETDAPARTTLVELLRDHGADRVDVVTTPPGQAALTVHLGGATRPDVVDALGGTAVPREAEGYAVRASARSGRLGAVALAGRDAAGQYYAVQTLRQLFVRTGDDWKISGAEVRDWPEMPLRGSIEGFYGQPWSHQERMDQMAFYGDVKANTYIYAPKDDPYHRERWREPYPADKLDELAELVDQAAAHHVRFTFALSPGNSMCFSGADDRAALLEKFEAMYGIGVRAFSIPLDDISLQFNCAEDQARYGTASQATVGQAQAELLTYVQREFVETHEGVQPLQTVPTQYGDLSETPYKQSWRTHLDPAVVVMWTGTDVVPPEITVEQAERISQLFGREVFVWDNYPVNDFGQTAGRLLLAPYDKREPGLSDHLAGIVSNPMNQAYASKLAMFTMFDFSWNDRGFDRPVSAHLAADYLAGGDPRVTRAVETFVDLNHAAPTFGCALWQPQSPRLDQRLQQFWSEWETSRSGAVAALRPTAQEIEDAPALIRGGVEPGFVADAEPHLEATTLWGGAMQAALDVLAAVTADDRAAAQAARDRMERLAREAGAIRSLPGKNSNEGPVKIADGVLDSFLADVAAEHDRYLGLEPQGKFSWWSGNDQNWADVRLARTLEVPGGSTDARFWMRNDYVMEKDWDFGFVEVSTDGGSTWTELKVYSQSGDEVSTPDGYPDPFGRLRDYGGKKYGLTGTTGGWARHYVDLTPYAGETIGIRLRLATDGGWLERGWFADDFSLTADGTTVWSDDVESGNAGWTSTAGTWTNTTGDGWRVVEGPPSTCPR